MPEKSFNHELCARPRLMNINGPVLVVDSNMVMAGIVAERLGQIGLSEVHLSASLRTTITLLEQHKFCLILSEYDTATITGFDLWRVITGRDEWKKIPFILMSTDERKRANIIRFEEAGLPMVLVKPFSADQLRASVDVVTSKNPFGVMV
jgi:two-component system, chemotaxis family, chemotaxis protein CheY